MSMSQLPSFASVSLLRCGVLGRMILPFEGFANALDDSGGEPWRAAAGLAFLVRQDRPRSLASEGGRGRLFEVSELLNSA